MTFGNDGIYFLYVVTVHLCMYGQFYFTPSVLNYTFRVGTAKTHLTAGAWVKQIAGEILIYLPSSPDDFFIFFLLMTSPWRENSIFTWNTWVNPTLSLHFSTLHP